MVEYKKLRRLTDAPEASIDGTLDRLALFLRSSGKNANVEITIHDGEAPRHWSLVLRKRDCSLKSGKAEAPDLEIISGEVVWREIAEGRISPLEAFTQGRLRILGNTELGSFLLTVAGEGNGVAEVCEG